MRAATGRVQTETDLCAAEERRRWDQHLKARKKKPNVRSDVSVLVAREDVTQEAVTKMGGQKCSVVVNEDSVVPASETASATTPAIPRSVQVTGDVRSQRSTGAAGAHQSAKNEVVVVKPGLRGQESAAVAESAAVVAPA